MTAPYEAEVRFFVPDPQAFWRRIKELHGRVVRPYAFVDHVYRPRSGPWDLSTRTLRLREDLLPKAGCEILLSAADVVTVGGLPFKRARLPEGKVRLFAGDRAACEQVLTELGFAPWFCVAHTEGTLWELPAHGGIILERITGRSQDREVSMGWMGEVEVPGQDAQAARARIAAKLELLRVSEEGIVPHPLPLLVARALGLLPVREESGPPA
jgi:hypothetical protein